MDNPNDDYLRDNEIRIRYLQTNLRTAITEIADLRALIPAETKETP